ncbi:MAG TPA: hypothetical protein GXX77_01415 [Candidatus Cloacimonetes bacterium]|nr:hypothetical protein [Candidatus Cloacimonadota bacterium]
MLRNVFAFSLIVALACSVFLMARPPQEHTLNTPLLDEASGLARGLKNPHLLYSHNDSGGKNSVYAIDSKGNLIAEIHLPTVKNRDWEEMATCIDPISKKPMIYVGDIGDNKAKYKNYRIHIFEEPLIEDSLVVVQDVRTIKYVYDDGARDAEAFFVHPTSGDIYIISKREEQVGIYHLPYPQESGETLTAKKLGVMQMSWVTAADISPDGKTVLVKNYGSIRRFKIGAKQNVAKALLKPGKSMPYILEPQGEAICFDASGKGYYTLSEQSGDKPQILYYYK